MRVNHRSHRPGDRQCPGAGIGDAAKERLLHAHFTEGADLSAAETLTRLLGEVGADPDRVRAVLAYAGEDVAPRR